MKKKWSLKTKRLRLTPMSDDELRQKRAEEPDQHMRSAYGEMLEGSENSPEAHRWYTAWGIVLSDTGDMIGDLCFKGPPVQGEVEIGYGIDEAYRRRGYAAEAVEAAVDWAFSQEGVYFVMAETEPGNIASQDLLKKLKFISAGIGEEGPRFERERPESAWMAVGMCLGMSAGMSLGSAFDKLSTGMCLGMGFGLMLGALLDSADRKKREAFRAARLQALESQ